MPFVWDGVKYWLTEVDEEYDPRRFVIVRKLHIKLGERSSTGTTLAGFNKNEIYRHLSKYGKISSIEFLPNNLSEAYAVFESDVNAYLVMVQHELDKKNNKECLFEVRLADPWEQPEFKSTPSAEIEYPTEVFELIKNEFCMLKVIEKLDMASSVNLYESCKTFKAFIDKHNCFGRFQLFEIFFDFMKATPEKLNENWRIIRYIGPHISVLKLVDNGNNNNQNGSSMCTSYMKMLAQACSTRRLRRATFYRFNLFDEYPRSIIAPILRDLESLRIVEEAGNENGIDIDFEAICPNLKELWLSMNIPLISCCKQWPTLQHLSITRNKLVTPATLESFIQQNTQISSLECYIWPAIISAAAAHLPNLRKLSLKLGHTDSHLDFLLENLGRFEYLTDMELTFPSWFSRRQDIGSIIDLLSGMSHLRRIDFSGGEFNGVDIESDRELINLAKQLNDLGEISFHKINLKESTLVEFVGIAGSKNLTKCHYSPGPNVQLSDAFVPNIVDELQHHGAPTNKPVKLHLNRWNVSENVDSKNYDGHIILVVPSKAFETSESVFQ